MDCQVSEVESFVKVSLTFQRWSIEILNPYTNGYTECQGLKDSEDESCILC